MPLIIEGDCPNDCDATLGVKVDDFLAMVAGDSVEEMLDKPGNKMHCPQCEQYVDPENVEMED